MKRITSISLGSSKRDHKAQITLEGEEYFLERIGTNGDMAAAQRMFEMSSAWEGPIFISTWQSGAIPYGMPGK
jgi:hypothetical protein